MDQVMDIVKLNNFRFFKERSWGIWIAKKKFGSWKQENRTSSRNFEGSKWYLWMYNYFIGLHTPSL